MQLRILEEILGGGTVRLKSLRVLRVLRPLRGINAIPSKLRLLLSNDVLRYEKACGSPDLSYP